MPSYGLQSGDGYLLTSGGMAVRQDCPPPDCCGGGEELLRAVECARCCASTAYGMPVSGLAVPGWQSLPVFTRFGVCWELLGPWQQADPPDWAIVREVDARFADCPSCSGVPGCPVLRPGCAVSGPVPDTYLLETRSAGRLTSGIGAGSSWDLTTRTRYVWTPGTCVTGCLTGTALRLGFPSPFAGDSFHTSRVLTAAQHTFDGSYHWVAGSIEVDWAPDGPYNTTGRGCRVEAAYQPFGGARAAGYLWWRFLGQNQNPGEVWLDHAWNRGYTGYFWLAGQSTATAAVTVRLSSETLGTGTAQVTWTLTPETYCCGGVGRPGPHDPHDPNLDAIEGYNARDPVGNCQGCGG